MSEEKRSYNCALCDEEFEGVGHKLVREGVCCDNCNITRVLPLRMRGVHL